MIELFIPGEPQTKPHFIARPMKKPPGAFLMPSDTPNKDKAKWRKHIEANIRAFLVMHQPEIFKPGEPTILEVWTYLPRPKSYPKKVLYHTKQKDTSNFGYFVENMLTGMLCDDDGQHVDLHWFKRLADEDHPSGVFIRISPKLGEPDHPLIHKENQDSLSLSLTP